MAAKKKPSRSQIDKAMLVAEKRYSGRKYVTGIDIGYKWTDGAVTDELCVRVHVQEKLRESMLEAAEVFPKEIEGVPLDVIEGHYKVRLATKPVDHQKRWPFVMGGTSTGHRDVTAGTIGTLVIDKNNGAPAILSNWHVLAGPTGVVGDDVLQPGRLDGGVAGVDTVARLGPSILNRDGDAAIAYLTGGRNWLPMMFGSFENLNNARLSRLGETLVKSGRTTAQTQGKVDGEGTYYIQYQIQPDVFERRGIRGFKIVHTPGASGELSSGGDSGSVWYNPNSKEAVGLHFAGEVDPDPLAEHAIACNMLTVLDKLDLRIAEPADLLSLNENAPQPESRVLNHYEAQSMDVLSSRSDSGPDSIGTFNHAHHPYESQSRSGNNNRCQCRHCGAFAAIERDDEGMERWRIPREHVSHADPLAASGLESMACPLSPLARLTIASQAFGKPSGQLLDPLRSVNSLFPDPTTGRASWRININERQNCGHVSRSEMQQAVYVYDVVDAMKS